MFQFVQSFVKMPGKKVKKNAGTRGSGRKSKEVEGKAKVEKVIDLVEIQNSGVKINIIETNTSSVKNNNHVQDKVKLEVKHVIKEEEKENVKPAEPEDSADESGFQELNSSQLEKSEDLNQGFLESKKSPALLDVGPSQSSTPKPKLEVLERASTRRASSVSVLSTTEDRTFEDYAKAGVPRNIIMMKHPLENTWTFWYQKNDPNVNWEQQLKQIVDVATIEDFWAVFHHLESASNLQEGQDYSLFKKGIIPDWSDVQNTKGGRMIVNMDREKQQLEQRARRERLDWLWLELLLVLIGEQAGEHSNQCNGATLNVKKRADRLSVWLRSAADLEGIREVGSMVKAALRLRQGQVYFQVSGLLLTFIVLIDRFLN